MNMETVKKCAEIAAQYRQNVFNVVDEDIQALLDELNAPPVVEEEIPVKTVRKAK
jgi:uncharacterized protein (DUF1778 family)